MPIVDLNPPIGQSVTYTSPDRWAMGNLWFCEKITGPAPTDAVATWEDGDSTFALRPQPEGHSHTPGDTKTTRFSDRATSEAVWHVGDNAICKVTSWIEGMELEGDTIRVVRAQMPSVPVPDVIHSWLDRAWNRYFLLFRRISGETLEDAWPKLSNPQLEKLAADVARHASTLCEFTSPRLQTITGCGVHGEPYLLGTPDLDAWPSWKPVIRPIFTPETLTTYLRDLGGEDPPDVGDAFHFYHPVMCPENVFVSVSGPEEEDVQVTAIVGWDGAGYYPHWWIAVKPRVSAGFALGDADAPELWGWNEKLSDALIDNEGFVCPLFWYMRFNEHKHEHQLGRVLPLM